MATFNEAMLARNRTFSIRVGTYANSDIKEASFSYGYIAGDTFKPGGTVAGSAKIVFTRILTNFNKLDKIYPEIGLLVDGRLQWTKMGEWYINDIQLDRNRNQTMLDLMDGMFKLNQPYLTDLSYPAQIRDVIREIVAKTGITLQTDDLGFRAIQHHIRSTPSKKDITFREVLSQAIQLLGFSAFFNRDGKLEIRGLKESGLTITADSYYLHGLERSEIEYQIAGITCKKDKETLSVGLRTGRSLELENSFMIQNILDSLYSDLKDLRYYPYSLKYQGHLRLDVGSWVTIVTNKGESFKVPVLHQSFNFKGGLSGQISADSKAGNDTQYIYKGFFAKKIEQVSTDLAAEVQQQLEYVNQKFEEQTGAIKTELEEGIRQGIVSANQKAESLATDIRKQIEQVSNQIAQEEQSQNAQIAESLRIAGLSNNLAQEAKQIATSANQSIANFGNQLQSTNDLLTQQAKDLLAQAQAQTDLTNRVTTVEDTANGTKMTVTELSKTVDGHAGQISSVNQRTKTVEDGLSGLTTKYENLSVGSRNLLTNTKTLADSRGNRFNTTDTYQGFTIAKSIIPQGYTQSYVDTFSQHTSVIVNGNMYIVSFYAKADAQTEIHCYFYSPNTTTSSLSSTGYSGNSPDGLAKVVIGTEWKRYWIVWTQNGASTTTDKSVILGRHFSKTNNFYMCAPALYDGNLNKDWSEANEDIRQVVAEYKQSSDQNYANLTQRMQTTEGNLSEAQTLLNQTSQQLQSKANQSSLDTLTGRVSNAETKITQTAEGLTQEITATRNMIPTDISSQNLLRGTKDMIKKGNTHKDDWYTEGAVLVDEIVDGYPFTFKKWSSGAKTSPSIEITVKSGVEYTFTAYIARENAGRLYFYLYDTWDYHITSATRRETIIESVGPEIQRFKITFVPTRDGKIRPRFAMSPSDQGWFMAGGYKLNRGPIASDWSLATEDLTTVTNFNRVEETVNSHTQTIGSVGATGTILDNLSRVTQTANLIQSEVLGTNGLKTQMSQLAGSWSIKNLTSAGTVLNQLNLNKDGTVKIDGKLVQITGTTYIQDGVIASAKIAGLDAGKVTTGYLDAARIATEAITADKLKVDQAFFNKLTVNEAYLSQLFAKNAFIAQVQAVTLSATKISGGILNATNGAMSINLNQANISFNSSATIDFNSSGNALRRRVGDVTGFLHFNDASAGGTYVGLGVTSHNEGINSQSAGRFAGVRIFRSNDTTDQTEIYGDKIVLSDSFSSNRQLSISTTKLDGFYEMANIIKSIKSLWKCWLHLNGIGWNLDNYDLRKAIINEYNTNNIG
ncbi:gp58-like family protein [Streptococcus sp. 20-1249]|uniref:gp58-like family protein n=1 Tax=Streptococcus hepaticus TaxID=3349163 RepID=UPI003747BA7E